MCQTIKPFFHVIYKDEMFCIVAGYKDSDAIAVCYKDQQYAHFMCGKLNADVEEARRHKEHDAFYEDHCI
ncbi:hypothetical protein AB832_08350 [Flavobacteriaceae bacterium (ex Bugula neritina AB1)]|jgi:hypothetical protein|nr:hypothetical protein AB832_08350 [Flavobacteriaceae bacterium (ex Bugula neritina AB1)]